MKDLSLAAALELVISAIKKYPPDEQERIMTAFQEVNSILQKYDDNVKRGLMEVVKAIVDTAIIE